MNIGTERRYIGAFRSDLDVRALEPDAALDRDLAGAEIALHVDIAGQPPEPAVERAGRARQRHRCGLRGAHAALDLKRLIGRRGFECGCGHLEDDRRPAGTFGNGDHRVAHLDDADPGEGRTGAQPQRTALGGMGPRAVWRRQHLEVGVPDLVALDQDVRAFEHKPADLDLAQEQRHRIEKQGELAHAREVGARPPGRIGEGHALGHHCRIAADLHRERHFRREFATGDLADLIGQSGLVAGEIARGAPNDAADRRQRNHRCKNPGQPPPWNAHAARFSLNRRPSKSRMPRSCGGSEAAARP